MLCTEVVDEFMDSNELYPLALSDASDEAILQAFLRGRMPQRLLGDLTAFLDVVSGPIAIRSSSLLEDSHYQPFAGIYSTYMIPSDGDRYQRLEMLSNAVKGVYASVFFQASKDYMTATQNVIDQEKMAVILQEVVGEAHGPRFYPTMSGVARSINYYPIGDEEPEEGTVSLALGLGKHIVDGGTSLRFSPAHPAQVLQTSEMEIALRETQTQFLALDLASLGHTMSTDDGFNLLRCRVRDAEADGTLQWIVSTFIPEDQQIYDGFYEGHNRKIISFAGVLQHDVVPLPQLLRLVLRLGEEEMRRPVEIEFAMNLAKERGRGDFRLLQIRPMVDQRMSLEQDLEAIADDECLLRSRLSIGHGITTDVCDLIYIDTEGYRPAMNQEIADDVERMNRRMLAEGRPYVLAGPGRWGSSDPWLGIPVKWPHISGARVIAEIGVDGYWVDPSQGTHFFQNLTSLGVAYLTVPFNSPTEGFFREDLLRAMEPEAVEGRVRLVHFPTPLRIMADGMKKHGLVMQ